MTKKILTLIFAATIGCAGKTPHANAPVINAGIRNGVTVTQGNLAWSLVAIVAEVEDGQSLCTGTLLSNETVLTAAHCVAHTSQMSIAFGNQVNLANPENLRPADGYVQNPNWDLLGEQAGDLALIHFTGGIPPGYKPVTLDKVGINVAIGGKVLVMGFGVTDGLNRKGSGILRATETKIVGTTASAEIVSDGRESSVCFGDSGGPMFVEQDGEWIQYAVAHSVMDQSCSQASLHTIVAKYIDWIVKTQARLEK